MYRNDKHVCLQRTKKKNTGPAGPNLSPIAFKKKKAMARRSGKPRGSGQSHVSIPGKDKWALDLDRIRGRPMFFAEREPDARNQFRRPGSV